jgi:hypothetical protein
MVNDKTLYGVGLGRALCSRKIGRLPAAIKELARLITDGTDPRFMTIVPVRRCGGCNGSGWEYRNEIAEAVCELCNGFKFLVDSPAEVLSIRTRNYDKRQETQRKK